MQLSCGSRTLDLSTPRVMGVLNLTSDSFSDGGQLLRGEAVDGDALLVRAEAMVAAGASILDLGAESTRPGARGVAEAVEIDRISMALSLLAPRVDAVLSVDSSTPAVFTVAAAAGAGLINDVRALQRPGAMAAAAATGLPLCLMHMQGEPGVMQDSPQYVDVVREVAAFLMARREVAIGAGVPEERILLDPGFGFGKTLEHNLDLLARLDELAALGPPLLVGLSRKRMIGELTGREVEDRVAGSLAAAVLAVDRGARIVRVHDVGETVDALRVAAAVAARRGADRSV